MLFLINFLRQDILAPFIVAYPRGFRRFGRFPVDIDVFIGREQARTIDISASGLMLETSLESLQTNHEVEITFKSWGGLLLACSRSNAR